MDLRIDRRIDAFRRISLEVTARGNRIGRTLGGW
jgi:hypothetical protein